MSKLFYRYGLPFRFEKGRMYCLEPVCLDIETANNHAEDPSQLITWIVSIQVLFRGEYYLFRYPEELIKWYENIIKRYRLEPDSKSQKVLVTYIHNASYDLSYLVPYINMLPDYDNDNQGIIEGKNKFLSYQRGPLEFRCSYRLSGVSLAKWCKDMNTPHKKAVGLMDYEAITYPDQELDENTDIYDRLDVICLKECLDAQFKYYGDDVATTVPTKTGYVRRELRRACGKDKNYRLKYFTDTRLTPTLYRYCQKSYAGGYTHNNRFWADRLIEVGRSYQYSPDSPKKIKVNKIKHRDFKSHYPTQATCYMGPVGKPIHLYKPEFPFKFPVKRVLALSNQFWYIVRVRITEAFLKDKNNSMPFMQECKLISPTISHMSCDNGRILSFKGDATMILDSITLKILLAQYHMRIDIQDVYRFKLGPLPQPIINTIDKYFKGKTDKKAIAKKLEDEFGKTDPQTMAAETDLLLDKAMLNSVYGCMATDPLRLSYELKSDMTFQPKNLIITETEAAEALDTYYNNRNSFLSYQLGCWVTAAARYELAEYIGVFNSEPDCECPGVGYEHVLYADTDSIFYISTPEIEKRIEALNKRKHEKAHYITLESGHDEYYDEFTEEPDCLAFKGLHSKCYGIVTDKGLEITVAGVPRATVIGLDKDNKPIYYTREAELAGISKERIIEQHNISLKVGRRPKNPVRAPLKALERLSESFTFYVNSGVCASYVGATGLNTPRVPTVLNVNGHEIHTAGGCVIKKLDSKVIHDLDHLAHKKYAQDLEFDNYINEMQNEII